MKFEITIAGRVRTGPGGKNLHLPNIPNTEQQLVLDTREGLGKVIFDGQLKMTRTKATTPEKERDVLRDGINAFCEFMAGEGRDNCNYVTRIQPLEGNVSTLINETAAAIILANVLSHSDEPLKWEPRKP